MTLAHGPAAIVIFWAVLGGIGASLLCRRCSRSSTPILKGRLRKRVYALVGASAAIAAAIGPLLGGFITTYVSWRVGFMLKAVVIAIVVSGIISEVVPRRVELETAVLPPRPLAMRACGGVEVHSRTGGTAA